MIFSPPGHCLCRLGLGWFRTTDKPRDLACVPFYTVAHYATMPSRLKATKLEIIISSSSHRVQNSHFPVVNCCPGLSWKFFRRSLASPTLRYKTFAINIRRACRTSYEPMPGQLRRAKPRLFALGTSGDNWSTTPLQTGFVHLSRNPRNVLSSHRKPVCSMN